MKKKDDMYLNFKDSPYRRKHKRRILVRGNLFYAIIVVLIALVIGIGAYLIVKESISEGNHMNVKEGIAISIEDLTISNSYDT